MTNKSVAGSESVSRATNFLKRELPVGWRGVGALSSEEREEFLITWRKKLVDAGLLGLSWPTEYGGAGMNLVDQSEVQRIFTEVGAPLLPAASDANGFALLGPTILAWGSEEQKRYFLPRILSGEHRWAQGYSEPDAGSDLFALRTKATLTDGEWVVDGQKVWTSHGQHANWLFTLVRTDPQAPKAKGLSFLLVPMEQPGVLVRTIRTMTGATEFCEVFLDSARTKAEHIIGKPGDGAKIGLALLGYERSTAAAGKYVGYAIEFRRLCRLAADHGLIDDRAIRQELARAYTKIEIMNELGRASIASAARGEQPERVVLRALAALRDDGLPDTGEIFPDRQRLVFLELLVPPVHVVLVQAPAQFGADAQQALLVRQFVAQTGLDHGLVQIPGGA